MNGVISLLMVSIVAHSHTTPAIKWIQVGTYYNFINSASQVTAKTGPCTILCNQSH